jgi:hypothetical protein
LEVAWFLLTQAVCIFIIVLFLVVRIVKTHNK